jgi:hypothetical protein
VALLVVEGYVYGGCGFIAGGEGVPGVCVDEGGGAANEREAVVTTARRARMVSCILDLWMLGVGVFHCAGGFKVDSLLF